MPIGRSTCSPVYVADVDGWLAPCGRMYRIWSVAWTGQTQLASVQVEDVNGRVTIRAQNIGCHLFQAYTKPLDSDGIFIRTLTAGTLYIQVE